MRGRVHGYEGYTPQEVTFPIRVLRLLGVRALIVTNAAGCLCPEWSPGDLMLITDHINLSGRNPLVGPNDPHLGPRFPDMSHAYDPLLNAKVHEAAAAAGLQLRRGIYAHVLGPSYETPAEIRMLRVLGADAVGMSTVPEVITAVHAGMRVAGISCLTNMAAGITDHPLSHAEVTATAEQASGRVIALLAALIPHVGSLPESAPA
jgi:purine-nucleoside phosphorylase